MLRCGMRTSARTDVLAHRAVGLCLLAGSTGFVAGCGGGGAVAPVQSPTEAAIPGRGREHVVGRGDTVYAIAWRHGVDYRVLARVNSIPDPYTILPGQRLLIPEPGDVVPLAPEPGAVLNEPAARGDVSTHGVDTPELPVVRPMPPSSPEPESSIKPPRKALAEAEVQSPQLVPGPASTPAPEPSLAARMVAGLSWTRPTVGRTVKGFGIGGNKGLDIEGVFEQPIRAAARGRVVYAGSGLIGYGKLVIVKHDSRLLSAYAHNERLHVGEGDAVKGGQHIADMGRSDKGHVMLHFEIRRDGKPVDPLPFLP